MKKIFVIDTNVLIHDPSSVFKFEDNEVVLPVEVLEELDKIKGERSTDRGNSSRKVHRNLQKLFEEDGNFSLKNGAKTPGGGTIRMLVNPWFNQSKLPEQLSLLRNSIGNLDKPDHRIIASALYVKSQSGRKQVVLVSNDINVRLKAKSVGLLTQIYRNDRVEEVDREGYRKIQLTETESESFSNNSLFIRRDNDFQLNEYMFAQLDNGGVMPVRHISNGRVVALNIPESFTIPGGIVVAPKNIEQAILLDALLDPTISLVTIDAKAGTGKTFMTIAGALIQVLGDNPMYNGISISRPIVTMGNDIGFLPGSVQEKLSPFLQPYFDNLDVLFTNPRVNPNKPGFQELNPDKIASMSKRERRDYYRDLDRHKANQVQAQANQVVQRNGQPSKPWQKLVQSGLLELEALTFIRGRSIPKRFFIMDESQNTTPHQAKTVATRMAEGSKLIVMGDVSQIDNPYVDKHSNGLVYLRDRMRGIPECVHLSLTEGVRSRLADIAAEKL